MTKKQWIKKLYIDVQLSQRFVAFQSFTQLFEVWTLQQVAILFFRLAQSTANGKGIRKNIEDERLESLIDL